MSEITAGADPPSSESPLSGPHVASSPVSSPGEGATGLPGVSHKDTNPITGSPPLGLVAPPPPKSPAPDTITLGVRFNTRVLGVGGGHGHPDHSSWRTSGERDSTSEID